MGKFSGANINIEIKMNHQEPQEIDDAWECPTCLQPFLPHHDYECGTCEAKASEHLRVTTMCRLLRELSGRESALIVERDKLKRQLDAERSKNNEYRDVISCLECDALASHGVNDGPCEAHKKVGNYLEAYLTERALADRLAEALRDTLRDIFNDQCKVVDFNRANLAFDAWKEARSEIHNS